MIVSFRHKGLKRFFDDDDRSKLPHEMLERIREILTALDNAVVVEQLGRSKLSIASAQRRPEGILGRYGAGQLAHCLSYWRWQCE